MTAALAPEDGAAGARQPTRRETALRLAGLVVGTATVTALIYRAGGWPWVVVVYSVIAIIMLHELGHYATAKWSGMKATEFFVGFGPKLWSITRGETEYGVKALPFGGYVRILGMTSLEELSAADEPRSFVNQPTRRRVLVASAGSIMHVLIALVLAFCALFFIGRPLPHYTVAVQGLVVVKGERTPAQVAGFRLGDRILAIDGRRVFGTADANGNLQTNATGIIEGAHGHLLRLLVQRGTHRLVLSATPRVLPDGSKSPALGVYLEGVQRLSHPGFAASASTAGWFVGVVSQDTFSAFGHAFSWHGLSSLYHDVVNSKAGATAAKNPNQTRSIIGAVVLGADAAKAGLLPFLEVLISLNISLGILNLFPMLPLDGGHVAIALYERVRTRRGRPRYRADVQKLMPYAYAFLGLLVVFVVSKAYLDLAHGVANPFG